MRGFSLVEVIVALVILEIGMVGVASMLRLAALNLRAAEELEELVAVAEGVADSLLTVASPAPDSVTLRGGSVRWLVTGRGAVRIVLSRADGRELTLTVREASP